MRENIMNSTVGSSTTTWRRIITYAGDADFLVTMNITMYVLVSDIQHIWS